MDDRPPSTPRSSADRRRSEPAPADRGAAERALDAFGRLARRGGERLVAWTDRTLRPGGIGERPALWGSLAAMGAIFAADAALGDAVRLEALYVFPIVAVALHCRQRAAVALAIAFAVVLQGAAASGNGTPMSLRMLDVAVAIAASLLAVGLARTVRRHFDASEERASTDALTGLPNRRAFDAVLEAELGIRRRHGGSFSLLMLDLDRFKALNDTAGHTAGDLALRVVSDTLRARVRASDAAARLGGDEFVVLLRQVSGADADRVRAGLVATIDRRLATAGFPVTASCGVATFDRPPPSAAAALALADQSMYARKAERRTTARGEARVSEPVR